MIPQVCDTSKRRCHYGCGRLQINAVHLLRLVYVCISECLSLPHLATVYQHDVTDHFLAVEDVRLTVVRHGEHNIFYVVRHTPPPPPPADTRQTTDDRVISPIKIGAVGDEQRGENVRTGSSEFTDDTTSVKYTLCSSFSHIAFEKRWNGRSSKKWKTIHVSAP